VPTVPKTLFQKIETTIIMGFSKLYYCRVSSNHPKNSRAKKIVELTLCTNRILTGLVCVHNQKSADVPKMAFQNIETTIIIYFSALYSTAAFIAIILNLIVLVRR